MTASGEVTANDQPPAAGERPTECMRDVLDHQLHAMLATRNSDGSIHAVPLVYLYSGGLLLMATSSMTQKARNIAARPEVTVTVDDRDNLRWVSAVGHAELLRGDRSRELNDQLYRQWMTDDGLRVVGRLLAEEEDVTIAVTPRRWLTWDGESGFYAPLRAAGIPLDQPERWFK
jgi:PPOX class probable F420-dependent enzyme